MKIELRYVVDCNVIVSAVLLLGSVPRKSLDSALERGKLLISEATIEELNDTLRRPRFNRYLAEADRLAFLAAIVREAEVVEINQVVSDCRDPRDNKVLELALCGHATALITGDQDLLVLHPFRGIAILTPHDFLLS